MKILVSACLLGRNCKYNGKNNYNPAVAAFLADKEVVEYCPEVMAGLGIPRTPIEIVDGVLMDRDGNNVDALLREAVAKAMVEIRELDIDCAILQSRSPTCGVNQVYNGTFSGKLIPGSGVFAQALKDAGYRVIDAEDVKMNAQVQFAMDQWSLSNLQAIYEREQSAVWSAESDRFGSVILKWNSTGQLASEYRMLRDLQGKRSCQVYEYDEARGLLLEERILPGTVLRQEPSREKRIEALASAFWEIHVPQQEGETYLDWLDKACTFCETHDVSGDLSRMAKQARYICAELFEKYPERVLLHGDLHHDNLLLRSDGSYAVIDPKGVVGPEILDLPRFVLNEADMRDDPAHMERVISLVSCSVGYPEEDLRKALFVEAVLANVWLVEDGLPVRGNWMELVCCLR